MCHQNANLTSVACCIFVVLVLCVSCYSVEESASRIEVAIKWPMTSGIESVSCYKFSELTAANSFLSSVAMDVNEADVIKNGETITITQLKSGFDNKRILQSYVVVELKVSGELRRSLVKVSEQDLKRRIIEIELQ